MIMASLGRVPSTGDVYEWGSYRFEVVDMDGLRVDKVLISPRPPQKRRPQEPRR
jgi:putative hemolysin